MATKKLKGLTGTQVTLMHKALKEIGSTKENPKFSLLVARNLNVLNPIVQGLEDGLETSDEYKEYLKEGKELWKKFETPAQIPGQMTITEEDWPKYKAELDKLEKKHKKLIDGYEEQKVKHEQNVKDPVGDLELFTIQTKHLPKAVSGAQLCHMIDLIE
jgi:hypothetical protein